MGSEMCIRDSLTDDPSWTPPATTTRVRLARPGSPTLGWLCAAYLSSPAAKALDYDGTQRVRARIIAGMMAEPVFPGADETFADFPVARLTPQALAVLRDRKAGLPHAANGRLKVLRAVCKWAVEQRHLTADPTAGLRRVHAPSEGHHTWTLAEVEKYEARHPVGTKARLALALLLYTGARRSDAVRLGRQHMGGNGLRWTAHKNRNRRPMVIDVEILAPLAEALAAGPTGAMVFLETDHGRPFTAAGFGNWFRERCDEAGLRNCSAHGLRKAAATLAADAGASALTLMSMFGWSTLAEAERYTRAADRRRLARAGMPLILEGRRGRNRT